MLVTVLDENDNPPVFSVPLPPLTLAEDALPGTLVATVLATDADGTRPNSEVRRGNGKTARRGCEVQEDIKKEMEQFSTMGRHS